MRRHSPYNYAFDNPIYFIDPDGMAPTIGWPTLDKAAAKVYEAYSDAKKYMSSLKFTAQASGSIFYGPGASLQLQAAGAKVGLSKGKLHTAVGGTITLQEDPSKREDENNGSVMNLEGTYRGKDDKVKTEEFKGGGSLVFGGSTSKEYSENLKTGEKTNMIEKDELNLGIVSASKETDTNTNKSEENLNYGIGIKAAAFIGFEMKLNIGLTTKSYEENGF